MGNNQTETHFDLTALADNWPSPLVARNQKQLDRFSGGILNARTLANESSLGIGPKVVIRCGRKVAYCKWALVEYLQAKANQGEVGQ